MTNNEVYDGRGNVIGFQCDTCDQVKTKMWGNVCNECRAKYEDKKDAPSGCRPQVVPTSTPERYRHVADQLESVGMEDNEHLRDEVITLLRRAATQEAEAKGWRDIATAPKDGTLVLLYDGCRVGIGNWRLLSGSSTRYPNGTIEHTQTFGWFGHNIASGEHATHWQPLPTPPIPPLSAEDQR